MKRSLGSLLYKYRSNLRDKKTIARFNKNIATHTPIIVYQMGKVGSMSIYNSLKSQYSGITLHRHELSAPDDWQVQTLLTHALVNKQPLKLISMVREPVGRNISAFFQNFEVITSIAPKDSKFSLPELNNIYFSNPKMDHTAPITWYDEKVKKLFGIDVYAEPFPKEEGWIIIKNANVELLLMKAEISDEKKTLLVKEFTGVKDFRLMPSNVSEDKDYATLYSEFKKAIQFPAGYLDSLYNSSLMQHFYTAAEIEKMRQKWSK
jgi:hypothetical protein